MKGLWIYPTAILMRLGLASFAIATLLVVSIGPRSARADTVNYDLSISGAGAPAVVGSSVLEYDTFSQMFTNLSFEVSWDSVSIPLYNQAIATDPTQSYYFVISVGSNGDYEAELINSDALMVVYGGETGPNGPPSYVQYDYAATLTSEVPEPALSGLVLLGGLILALQKWTLQNRRGKSGQTGVLSYGVPPAE